MRTGWIFSSDSSGVLSRLAFIPTSQPTMSSPRKRRKLLPARDVLILLDDEVPDDWKTLFSRFNRVIDIVGAAETERQPARQRFKIYRSAGLSPIAHDQGAQNA